MEPSQEQLTKMAEILRFMGWMPNGYTLEEQRSYKACGYTIETDEAALSKVVNIGSKPKEILDTMSKRAWDVDSYDKKETERQLRAAMIYAGLL